MVVGAYFPELAGGSLQCRTLVSALSDRVRFTVLTTTSIPDGPERSEIEGVPVYRVYVDPASAMSKLAAAWRFLCLLPQLLRDHDLFHFHGFTEKMLLLLAAAKCFGRPTIEKPTSLGWDDPVAIRRRPLGGWLAAAQTRVDRIVAVTPAMRDQCVRAGVPESLVVSIPNGVDVDRFAPVDDGRRLELRARLGLPPDACLVTFVGFWSREKAPDLLFAAWQRARSQTNADTVLLFIGSSDGEHPEADAALAAGVRQSVAAADLGERVFFVERTDDVASYLGASDIFVLPSSREGLSNALLEAMSTGLACVCADIPGGANVIESGVNGWHVPPGEMEPLAAVLATLIGDPRVGRDAGARARAAIVDRFSIQRVASAYAELYGALVAPPLESPPATTTARLTRQWRAAFLGTAVLLGALWIPWIPPFEGVDEAVHFTALRRGVRSITPIPMPTLTVNPVFRADSNRRGQLNAFMHGRLETANPTVLSRLYLFRGIAWLAWMVSIAVVFDTARMATGRADLAFAAAGLALCLPGATSLFATLQLAASGGVLVGSVLYWAMTAWAVGRMGWIPAAIAAPLAIVTAWRMQVFEMLRSAIAPLFSSAATGSLPTDALEYTLFEFLPRVFFGFWGWLGQQSLLLPAIFYAIAAAATVLAACGLLWRTRIGLSPSQRRIAAVYGVGIVCTLLALYVVSLFVDRTTAAAPWLYVSISPLAIGLIVGWRNAAAAARRSPHLIAAPLAALAAVLVLLRVSAFADLPALARFHYTGDTAHLGRTLSCSILFFLVLAFVTMAIPWTRCGARGSGAPRRLTAIALGVAVVANVTLLVGFARPRFEPLNADELAKAAREAAADGETAAALDLYRLGSRAYPDSVAVSDLVMQVPEFEFTGSHESVFRELRARLAAGQALTDRTELMRIAQMAAAQQAFGPEILRAIVHRTARTPDTREPLALMEALAGGGTDAGDADAVRAAGGTLTPQNMHGDAALAGYTLHSAAGRREVTLYFRPLRPWVGRALWVHAYPEGSRDYDLLPQISNAYAQWRPGALAWETFALPAGSFVLYVGVEVNHDLGPAYPIGAVR
jgi:glycosyltransferase involved in cell wall biosynthesis